MATLSKHYMFLVDTYNSVNDGSESKVPETSDVMRLSYKYLSGKNNTI